MKSFENSSNSTYNSNGNDKMEKVKSSSKFKRKDKRTISLVEKSKMGSQIHKEELRLSVTNSLFVSEVKGLPNKKYQIMSKIGSGAYGTVYLAQNIITKANVGSVLSIRKSSSLICRHSC